MPSIHAYYHSDGPASGPVSIDRLGALGWNISFVEGNTVEELEEAGRKVVEKKGYPVTVEGCVVRFNMKQEENMTEQMKTVFDASKPSDGVTGNLCTNQDAITVITSGSTYIDIEDIHEKTWIHLDLFPGLLLTLPQGAKYRLNFNAENSKTTRTVFFQLNHEILMDEAIETHSARAAYLAKHT